MECGGGYPHVVSYLLQQTLRRLCTESDWVYAVFWRILPRNYPPPKWDSESSVLDRSKGNKRNWILVWEDGFCDFVACAKAAIFASENTASASLSHNSDSPDHQLPNASILDQACAGSHNIQFMQPELFFKMSHDVYNFGEGLMGKVAADNSHKWIYKEPMEADSQYPSSWQGALDPHPRTWEAQFKSGIETIAIVAVKEGVLQLGSLKKSNEDLSFVLSLQRKFNYLQSIPGVYAVHPVLMQHATSSRPAACLPPAPAVADSLTSEPPHHHLPADHWPPDHHLHRSSQHYQQLHVGLPAGNQRPPPQIDAYHVMQAALPCQAIQRLPHQLDGMQASLQALLSRLPSVTAPPPSTASSSSTSPTGHPYNICQPFVHHNVPGHQHFGFTPAYTQPQSDQDLDPATSFFKGHNS